MTNSISTTVVEVTKNIHDTVINGLMNVKAKHMTVKLNFMSSSHDKDTGRL